MKNTTDKKEALVRINSRIRVDQHKYAKELAEKRGVPEGEIHREIFDYYIKKHK